MRILAALFVAVMLMPTTSALAADRQPSWVNGTPQFYPNELYIVGVGSGDERQEAETRARAAVSAVFSVRVAQKTSISASQAEVVEDGKTKFSSTHAVIQDATAVTSRVLEGVAIAESWEDPTTHRLYALAVLNRKKAALVMRDKLRDVETASKPHIARLTAETDPMRRAGAGFRVQSLATSRSALIDDLRVIQPGAEVDSEVDWDAARRLADSSVRALQVSLRVEGSENASAIQTSTIKALSALGIRIAESSTRPDIAIRVSLELAMSGPTDGWFYARLTATAAATDVKAGTQMTQFDASIRQAASDPREASRRSAEAVAKKIAEGLQPALRAFFEGDH